MVKKYTHFFDKDTTQELIKQACYLTKEIHIFRLLICSMTAGAFITFGALFSVLLASGINIPGYVRLLEGFGFSTGFFFVIVSQSILFTEANVLMPISLLRCTKKELLRGVLRLWIIAFIGNFLGAFIAGHLITFAQHYPKHTLNLLHELVQMKMQYQTVGTVSSYFEVILSGSLANWLVGLALFFATMSKNVASKFIPIFLAVSVFVAANFQHSPANMGYFSLYIPIHQNLTWLDAFLWNILPAGIGNILGGFVFVALPLWYTVRVKT